MSTRTFTLTSPHMTGDDVKAFQRDLSERFASWEIAREVADDGDYGSDTRLAARQACRALGLDNATEHGVTPELRHKIRDPGLRSAVEVERSKSGAIKGYRTKLRRKFASRVTIDEGANRPGVPLAPETLAYVERVARGCHRTIVVTTGSNHKKFSRPGVISDHWTGHAVDLGMIRNHGTNDGPVGDVIMAAALVEAGLTRADALAKAKAGGLFTLVHAGLRIQCIWKAPDHHDHVHIGVRPV